jgi:hypothetical protein
MKLHLPKLEIECVRVQRRPALWATVQPFPFEIDGEARSVPNRFVNDKYSVPLPLQPIMPRRRKTKKENTPAVLHDYLVRNYKLLGITLMDAHDLFLQAMRICSMYMPLSYVKYAGVVIGSPWQGQGDGTPPKKVQEFIDKYEWGN